MTGRPKTSRPTITQPSSTPWTDALRRVLAEKYRTTWQEAWAQFKAGIRPDGGRIEWKKGRTRKQ